MVRHILPGLRSAVAVELRESYKLSQLDISNLLGVSQPAVSQYMRQIRGVRMLKNDAVRKNISNLCEKIYRNRIGYPEIMVEFCELCQLIRRERLVCGMHKNEYDVGDCMNCVKVRNAS
jgi:predicted transcriptional regulator